MEEDKLHGERGIDLESERAKLNYRPTPYERVPDRRGVPETATPGTNGEEDRDSDFDFGLIRIIEQILEYEELLKETRKRILSVLGNVSVNIPENMRDLGTEKGLGESMTANDYVRLLGEHGQGIAEALAALWERQAEDVDGSLPMEYLEDVVEMEGNLSQIKRLVDEALLSSHGLRFGEDEKLVEQLKKAEEARQESKKKLEEEMQETKQKLRAHVLDNDLLEEAILKDKSLVLRKRAREMSLEDRDREWMKEIVNEKMREESRVLRRMNTYLDEDTTPKASYMEGFLTSMESEEELKASIVRAKGLLRMSVDVDIEEKTSKKRIIRHHLGLGKRERLQRHMLDAMDVESSWARDWKFLMLEKESTDEETDRFLNALAKGLSKNEEQMKKSMEDLCKMQVIESKTRKEKIELVREKEDARQAYQLMRRHLDEM